MPAVPRIPTERVRQLLAKGLTARQVSERLAINRTSVDRIAAAMRKEATR